MVTVTLKRSKSPYLPILAEWKIPGSTYRYSKVFGSKEAAKAFFNSYLGGYRLFDHTA